MEVNQLNHYAHQDRYGRTEKISLESIAEIQYTYSKNLLDRLTRTVGVCSQVYRFTYDGVGNIRSASDGTEQGTHTYTYGDAVWKDLLTAFDGESITYDNSGNPKEYYNGADWTFTWQEGRRLATANGGGKALTFTYDSDGLRLTKKVGNTTYSYLYAGGKLMRQTDGTNTLDFFYSENGHPYALKHNGTIYYYVTNLQGDVLKIVYKDEDDAIQVAASYTYDPYGKVLSATGSLAEINPLRYRGYVYDSETGFYYLQSRYYDPAIGRFINADSSNLLGANNDLASLNLFTYCGNNPISREDIGGEFWNIVIGAVVGAIAGVVGQVISDVVTSLIEGEVKISNWQTYTGAAIGGAAGGVVLATTGNMNAANMVTGALTTGVGQSLEKLTIDGYDKSWGEIAGNAVADGLISFGLGKIPGIKGATAGRNSWSAVYKSGLTKLRNHTASRMSARVIAKGIGSSIAGGFALDGYYGAKQYAYDKTKAKIVDLLS